MSTSPFAKTLALFRNVIVVFLALLTCGLIVSESKAGSAPQIVGPEPYSWTFVGVSTSICAQVISAEPVQVQWFFNSNAVPRGTTPCLPFSSASIGDDGHYFLVASNAFGVTTSSIVSFEVSYRYWLQSYGSEIRQAGENIHMEVLSFDGELIAPNLRVKWFHNGGRIPNQNGRILNLIEVTPKASGEYFAVVADLTNDTHRSSAVAIQVQESAPLLNDVPFLHFGIEGDHFEMKTIKVAGNNVRYQWWHDGTRIPRATRLALLFDGLSTNDAGVYELVATNPQGEQHLFFTNNVRPATVLDDWTWLSPSPQGGRLRSITYGRGRFVAVGNSGNVVMSQDGAQWNAAWIPGGNFFLSVTYGNGLFYAATDNLGIFVSNDGLNWRPIISPGSWWSGDLSFANGRVVTVSDGNLVQTLRRGHEWHGQSIPAWLMFQAGNRLFAVDFSGASWNFHTPTTRSIGILAIRWVRPLEPYSITEFPQWPTARSSSQSRPSKTYLPPVMAKHGQKPRASPMHSVLWPSLRAVNGMS